MATRKYPYLRGDYETAQQFADITREYVAWGDEQVEAEQMSEAEQTQRLRAALADALWWIENRSQEPPWTK